MILLASSGIAIGQLFILLRSHCVSSEMVGVLQEELAKVFCSGSMKA